MIEQRHHGLFVSADTDPNTVYTTGSYVQHVTDIGKLLLIDDPQLGVFTIGGDRTPYERLMYELFTTPGMVRSNGISQLCKDEASATIPNTAFFTRYSGLVALSGIFDHFGRKSNLSDEAMIALQLGGAQDDAAHKFFSHATELKLQGWGGRETKHQADWPAYAFHGGTTAVLDKYNVKYDGNIRLVGTKLPPWADAEAPDIDPDRLQYTVTELLEWFDNDNTPADTRSFIRQLCSLDNFGLDNDGFLGFKDIEMAQLFSKAYLLLSTEHWNDPVNRMQLYLLTQAVQRLIVKRSLPRMNEVDNGLTRRPEDYFNGIDQDVVDALNENHGHTDPTLFAIHNALYPIASAERKRFVRYKVREYGRFLMDENARDYPSEHLTPKRVEFGLSHPSVAIKMTQSTPEERARSLRMPIPQTKRGKLEYVLMPLKNRHVDPRVIRGDGSSTRLSELDSNYRELLRQQQVLQSMKTEVQLVFSSKFSHDFTRDIKANETAFDRLASSPDFTSDQKRHIIELAADRARRLAIDAGRLVLA